MMKKQVYIRMLSSQVVGVCLHAFVNYFLRCIDAELSEAPPNLCMYHSESHHLIIVEDELSVQ